MKHFSVLVCFCLLGDKRGGAVLPGFMGACGNGFWLQRPLQWGWDGS